MVGAEDRHVPPPPGLRGLSVQSPRQPARPARHDRGGRWKTVTEAAPAQLAAALVRLLGSRGEPRRSALGRQIDLELVSVAFREFPHLSNQVE